MSKGPVASAFQPIDARTSPRFGQVPTFMRLPHSRALDRLDVVLVGLPYDGGTSYRPGARFGPREVRCQSCFIRPYNPALDVAPFEVLRVADYGDLDVPPTDITRANDAIEKGMAAIVRRGVVPVAVGGDHSVTLPALRAVAQARGPMALVHIDAHLDTWDEYFGSKFFHGTPFRRAVEEELVDPRAMIQIGIRGPTYSREDLTFQREHGIEVITADSLRTRGVPWVLGRVRRLRGRPTYLSFDIDSVDPAYAPGTGTPEVGGLTASEALLLLRGLAGLDLVGADVVEVAPPYDGPGQITALLAANVLFDILSVLAVSRRRGGKGAGPRGASRGHGAARRRRG